LRTAIFCVTLLRTQQGRRRSEGDTTDQRETADQDHDDDERLEVLVLDEDEVDVAPVEPRASDARPVERVPELAAGRAALGTALVRVLDVDDRHLVDLRLRLQTPALLRVGRRVHFVVVVVVVVVVVERRPVEIAESERRLTVVVAATEAELSVTSMLAPHPVVDVDVVVGLGDVVRVLVLTAAVALLVIITERIDKTSTQWRNDRPRRPCNAGEPARVWGLLCQPPSYDATNVVSH